MNCGIDLSLCGNGTFNCGDSTPVSAVVIFDSVTVTLNSAAVTFDSVLIISFSVYDTIVPMDNTFNSAVD